MKTNQEIRKIKLRQALIIFLIAYIAIAFVCIHIGTVFNSYEHFSYSDFSKFEKDVIKSIKSVSFFIPKKEDLILLIYVSMLYAAGILYYITFSKKYMFGREHGSSRWATSKEIKRITDKNEDYNIIFTETEKMTLDNKKLRKNVNTVVVGSPGTGKSWGHVKPNILQASCSYVITDPKGELLEDTGSFFVKKGYKKRVLNLKDMGCSMCYNPFVYIKKETDVIKLIDCLIKNTNKNVQSSADPFWEKAEIALLQAVFYYIYYEIVDEEHNFKTVMELLRLAEAREDDEGFKSDLDIIFDQLEIEKPGHIACKQYMIFKLGAGKTIKSILISIGVRLSIFNIKAVSDLMMKDELQLDKIGDEKTVLFVVIPDATDTTFNFIAAMMYTQLFDTLYGVADASKNRKVKVHVRCILDEFANIGRIPNFEKLITTMRSREISVSIIIQALSQIKEMYEKTWEGMLGTCSSLLFLGSQEQSTLEYISKRFGKETIDTRNINNSKGNHGSTTWNYGLVGRELMTPDEIGCMPDDDCILIIAGMHPFYSKKYNLKKHKNYKFLADYNDANKFDFSKYRKSENEKLAESERERILEHYNLEDFNLEQEQLNKLFLFSFEEEIDLDESNEIKESIKNINY